ncbi:hypothetical protein GCM10010193_70780 [Kitasatospora atroaurantiaca]|uniref:Uncharacterized protein n=1 Tax=Kitasatospora atroaurantiaca TaxID=285545 RepID=A0A561ENI1_9ACTN|nr:hypothetical protein [Kitasatospora atroaurantiaca]TWE17164.1 hypothetical protein FB465_2169 [Kitasatospora atroaurantiaca]
MRILGREPALLLALVAVVVKTGAAFGLHVSTDQQAAINAAAAALVGLIVAFMAHDGVAAAILGAAQALLALAVGLGLHWSADQQAVTMSLIAVLISMFVRTQITAPVPPPLLSAGPAANSASTER